MNAFEIKIEQNSIRALLDTRYGYPVDVTDGTGRFGWMVYTLKSDDITTADKPGFVPYNSRYVGFSTCEGGTDGWQLENPAYDLKLSVRSLEDRVILEQRGGGADVSACGIFLPLNFLSDKNGTYEHQFLVSSPYHTADRAHWMYFFTRPDGHHLAVVAEEAMDGYRICYSPYLSGHFIRGIEFLRSFDRAYHMPSRTDDRLRLHILPVSSYREALEKAAEIWECPALYYRSASVKCGEKFVFEPIGKVNSIRVSAPSGRQTVVNGLEYIPEEYGIHTAVPEQGGVDCAFYAWDDRNAIFKRACDALPENREDVIGNLPDGTPVWRPPYLFYRGYEDHNLCEHGMWCWALLRYMRRFGVCEPYASTVKNFLHIVMGDSETARLNCCTMLEEQDYRTQNSTRIQEAYNGINILLDAWLVFGERKYLDFAIKAMDRRLECDLGADGGIYRYGSDGATAEIADYTTVTCMVFPVVTMARILQQQGNCRAEKYCKYAEKIADFVVARDLSFPTEGGHHPEVNDEMEEGSISCSALTVAYVARHIICKDSYVVYAKKILDLHDAFSVYTPHPVMYRSSLRWWETIWEGDSDGPAVCFGHAWSLWRAEAQFWYGLLAHDDARLYDSYQGFMGNYAKADDQGNMYSIYQYEPLSGGALTDNGRDMDYSVHDGFPRRRDVTLSYYLFARDFECWQQTVAVLSVGGRECVLGGTMQNGMIVPNCEPGRLVLGDVRGKYFIKAEVMPEIVSTYPYTVQPIADGWQVKILHDE